MQQPAIIDRGRGPEIAGTRITVYNILDYLEEGWHHTQIALFFRISSRQVLAAIEYIDGHREQVMADYREMLARSARGNPPDLQAKLDAGHERFLQKARERSLAPAQPIQRPRMTENGDANPDAIMDYGRGPQVAGTRITVYDILDYLRMDWDPNRIALFFRMSTAQVLAAIAYIDAHQEAVMASYGAMLERDARGNPPELQARLEAGHARLLKSVQTNYEADGSESIDAGHRSGR